MISPFGIFPMGDSRTDGDVWVNLLLGALLPQGMPTESPTRFAAAGWKTSDLKTYIDANLAAQTGLGNYVIINIGSNDLVSMPVEATWKTAMLAILDAIHAWKPGAQVYLAKPWRQTYGTEADTYASWVDDVVALRSFAHVGPDERVWMEGGDDGATMTTDGIHYSAAGQIECAAQWKAALGL